MIRGTELFEVREVYLSEIPENYPPIYSLFYSMYVIGKGKLRSFGVFLEQINQVAGIFEQKINSEEDFMLYDFLSFEESLVFTKNSYENAELDSEYFPIAECDSNKAILVGIGVSNRDQIFLENLNRFNTGERYKLIANNVFEFVHKIELLELPKIGYGIDNYNQLYKNWGEDFWRVRQV